ncbi:putative karyogamy protein [Golovinomyces cichoracearum]|uniref:Putative karyogamy protein n=1 Tax=Golovinomyces cichoracearum TaxID=62708 RepID=A0A420I6F6_9PEZI|nr:putative karyogamy protein [Golovinomyces cichoracearum]
MFSEGHVSALPKRPDLKKTQIPSAIQNHNSSRTVFDQQQRRKVRKPSPGVAARLQALGFGQSPIIPEIQPNSNDKIGRISEDQINRLDDRHRASINTSGNLREHNQRSSSRKLIKETDKISAEIAVANFRTYEPTRLQNSAVIPPKVASMANTEKIVENSQTKSLPAPPSSNVTNECSKKEDNQVETCSPLSMTLEKYTTGSKVLENTIGFNPSGLQRSGSIYTISRASFTSQLAQLTSLQLPDAESLSSKISAIPLAKVALKALIRVSEQIRSWIFKASEVIAGLGGEDDVEWAAAGGREGLAEVDKAINRFEKLIDVYVAAIELLQNRKDISDVPREEHEIMVSQVEIILAEWTKIKKTLKDVKSSVEIAMEWEELWNTVLGDIGTEMNVLKKLVFEMEEKRHKFVIRNDVNELGLAELETIVEGTSLSSKNQILSAKKSPTLSIQVQNKQESLENNHDDTKLLALFARMQPLRASLDFSPMRLSAFVARAEKVFPTSCRDLEIKLSELESDWTSLKKDAESLQKELGEDRWVLVFRASARQAQNIYESVEWSFIKLRQVVDRDGYVDKSTSLFKRYEKKKKHYGPAIERLLSIINKGIEDRLTINGEIIRLHWVMQHKWQVLVDQMNDLDKTLSNIKLDEKSQKNRESISSINFNDHIGTSSLYDTSGSSPASSVVTTSRRGNLDPEISRLPQSRNQSKLQVEERRFSSLPVSTSHSYRKVMPNRFSSLSTSLASYSSPKQKQVLSTPAGNRFSKSYQTNKSDGKPRWNSSTKVLEGSIGHNHKYTSYTTSSPNSLSKPPSTNTSYKSAESKTPAHSLPNRSDELRSKTDTTSSRTLNSRLSFRERLSERIFTPGRSFQAATKSSPNQPWLYSQNLISASETGLKERTQPQDISMDYTPSRPNRPVSSLGANRRTSLLPIPKKKQSNSSALKTLLAQR